MYKPQKVYYPKRAIEQLLYVYQVWLTFTDRQKDNIYETAELDHVQ